MNKTLSPKRIQMFIALCFVALVAIHVQTTSAATVAAASERGLVGFWKMEETSGTVHDYSASKSIGTMQGTTVTLATRATGKIGRALAFDGVDDYVSIVGSGLNNLQTGTISMWVKWSGTQDQGAVADAYGAVLSRQINGAVSNQIIALNGSNPNTAKIMWRPYSPSVSAIVSSSSPGSGSWRHIVVTYASGSHAMYIDGVLNGTGTTTGSMYSASIPLGIGAWYGDGAAYSTSLIDHVRIYNRVLTASEIADLYAEKGTVSGAINNVNSGTNGGLVGRWTFDGKNMTNATATDSSGAGNNASLSGTPTKMIGKVGQGLNFSGAYAAIASSSSIALTSNFTWAYWVKYTAYPGQAAIGMEWWNGSAGYFSSLCVGCAATPRITFGRRGAAHDVTASTAISLNKWYHITTTVDGSGNVRIYVNGVLDGSGATSLTAPAGNLVLSDSSGSFPLSGALDDARVYSRALTAKEVYNLYKMGGK